MTTKQRKRDGSLLLLSLVLAPFALVVTIGALMEWPPHLFGEATEGVIVKLGEGGDDTVSYYLEYDYWVDGVRYRKSFEETSLKWYQQLPDSGNVTVLYLPSAPHIARIKGNIFYRDGATAFACWLDVFVFGIFGLMGFAVKKPPKTEQAKQLISCILVGELAMAIGTIIGWIGALMVVGSFRGFIGLGVGLLVGIVAGLYTRQSGIILAFIHANSESDLKQKQEA